MTPSVPLTPNNEEESVNPITWIVIAVATGVVAALVAFFVFVSSHSRESQRPIASSWDKFPDATGSLLDRAIPVEELVPPQAAKNLANASGSGRGTERRRDEWWKEDFPVAIRGEALTATEIYNRISPAVVQIEVYDARKKLVASGSGFIVTENGALVTNLHVIEGAVEAKARFADGSVAEIAGFTAVDREADLIVLKMPIARSFPTLRLAPDLPPVGSPVYAIGNPQGLTNSLSDGIVSGQRRISDTLTMIQTNAAISPGSSGGPLVAEDGRVIGVTTALLRSGQNLNLAVPAARALSLLERGKTLKPLAELRTSSGVVLANRSMSDDTVALDAVKEAMRKRDWAAALRALRQVPSERRGKGYWSSLALVHEELGSLKDAYEAYVKAIEEEPDSQSLVRLALVANRLRSDQSLRFLKHDEVEAYFSTARKTCEAAIQLDPENADAYNFRGFLERNLDNQKAVGSYNTAIALRPNDLGARYNLAMLYLDMKNDSKVVELLQAALRFIDHTSEYKIESFDDGEPVTAFTNSGSIEVLIFLGLGFAQGRQGRFADAIASWERVLAIEPNNAVACWGLWAAYTEWRRNPKDPDALKWERRAEQLGSSNARYLQIIAGWRLLYISHK